VASHQPEGKPSKPTSRSAVTGLYFYDERVVDTAASVQTSKRGDLKITDMDMAYMQAGDFKVGIL
jgi:glucose-1-phosphate thymidylyltransferase